MMRLDKFLAYAGLGTRKEVKLLIKDKRILVNGTTAKKEDIKIDENLDCVELDGEKISYQEFWYIMMNKPQGVISATEDPNQETVLDLIHESIRDCFPVGRLDKDTEGLLLISNDGQLAHELLSPKKHVEKEYEVQLSKPLTSENMLEIEKGITLDQNEVCKPARIKVHDDTHCTLWISEGKYHQVKRMMLACGSEVVALKRIAMGPLRLDEKLKPGEYRMCTEEEIEALRRK